MPDYPLDNQEYTAYAVTGLQLHTYGSGGAVEIGVIGTVAGGEWGDKLWFITVASLGLVPAIGQAFPVRFKAAAYYSHDSEHSRPGPHDDERFQAI